MLLRGTESLATTAEFASSTLTVSVGCGAWAAANLASSKSASVRKIAVANVARPMTGLCMRVSAITS